jgi:drug/metabolite transporter (DMT)-like permease
MDVESILVSATASVFGLAYLTYGKKQGRIWFALSGVILMVYPYMVDSFSVSLGVGAVLLAAPFLLERFFSS